MKRAITEEWKQRHEREGWGGKGEREGRVKEGKETTGASEVHVIARRVLFLG